MQYWGMTLTWFYDTQLKTSLCQLYNCCILVRRRCTRWCRTLSSYPQPFYLGLSSGQIPRLIILFVILLVPLAQLIPELDHLINREWPLCWVTIPILEFVEFCSCSQKTHLSRWLILRLQVAPLSLSPSCVTRNTKGLLVVYCYSSEYSPIRDTIFHAGYDLGRFPFDEKFLNFWSRSRSNLWGNFLGMFTEDPTIIEFLQFEPMRSPGNSERQRKWHVTPGQGIFRKFGYTSRGCPLS